LTLAERCQNLLKSTGLYSIAVFAGRMASFILLPIYTRYLSPADYGVMELLDLTGSVLTILIGMRFGQSLFYFCSLDISQKQRDKYISTATFGAVLLGGMGALIGMVCSRPLSLIIFGTPQYANLLHLVFLTFGISLVVEVGFCYMRMLDRSGTYARVSLYRLAVAIALNLLLLVTFRMGIGGILWSSLIVAAGTGCYMLWYVLSPIQISFDFRLFAELCRYSFPLGISGLSMFLLHYGDRFFLLKYVSLSEIGIYALAYKLGMIISYLQMPFDIYWNAQMFSIVKGPDGDKVYTRVCTYLMLGLTFAVVLLGLFITPIIGVLAGPGFHAAGSLVPWIAAAYVIRTVGAHFRSVFLLKKETAKDARVTIVGAAACLLAYALLIPSFGIWGAAVATGVGFAVMFVFGLWDAQRVRRFEFEFRRMWTIAICAVVILSVFALIKPANLWGQISVALLFTALFPALLLLSRFFTDTEKQAMHLVWQRGIAWSRRSLSYEV